MVEVNDSSLLQRSQLGIKTLSGHLLPEVLH
jgi:hypothetical protein